MNIYKLYNIQYLLAENKLDDYTVCDLIFDYSVIEFISCLYGCSNSEKFFIAKTICEFHLNVSNIKLRILARYLDKIIQSPCFYANFYKDDFDVFLNNKYISKKSKNRLQ